MKIIENKLIAEDGYLLKDKNDNYIPEYIDEFGNVIPEHYPYLTDVIYLGKQITTLEEAKELYEEVE